VGPRNFFAVGTNMDSEHLRRTVPGALRLTVARLPGYTVRWHKRSGPEGKLAAYETTNAADAAWGVVYELGPADFRLIDDAQRHAGYVGNHVRVVDKDGIQHQASVYVAQADVIDDSLKPRRSYRDPIVKAARANGLPDDYVEQLALTPTLD
jgi:AIG2 family protein